MMFGLARDWSERPMLRGYRSGKWHSITWGAFGRMAAAAARGLRAVGVSAGDRVVIVSENRPEYPIAETALMAVRAVPVPTYTTNTVPDHAHILKDSGARAAIFSTPALGRRLQEAGRQAGRLDLLISMDDRPHVEDEGVRIVPWEELVRHRGPADEIALEAAEIEGGAPACLLYTSGTGGTPKGVMLPHRAILANCRGAFERMRPLNMRDEVYLSFLPLAHAFEHTAGQFFLLSTGAEIVYARSVEALATDLQMIKPTIMIVVPRLLEAMRTRMLMQLGREPNWRRGLFDRAMAVGMRRLEGRLSLADRILDPLLESLVRQRIRARFGGRLKAMMSGGAPLDSDVGRFFLALGIKVMQGYGQTEAGPVISANPPDAIRIDTVGPPLPGVEVRIAEDGDILVRGELVMDGYWSQPEATREVIRDGWLHTGDVGEQDADGYLRITDRKRDLIVLSGGENVSPARIEAMLMAEPEIAQAVIAGEGRSGLLALVVPSYEHDEAEAAVAVAVSRVNQRLSVTERIRRHIPVQPFTVDNGLLTPTQKIRRLLVLRAHTETLARPHP
ncbi:MAG: long-chain fatty acid--CoA ligase [Acetobacteraceae bacterium]|nr:long-chain fatty acid--CoA ligase [Acetobacteraceae bacterium]